MKIKEQEFVPNPGDQEGQNTFWNKLGKFSIIRSLQLGVGGLFVGDYVFSSGEWPVLLLGSILLWQGLFNKQMGCAGRTCQLPDAYTDRK